MSILKRKSFLPGIKKNSNTLPSEYLSTIKGPRVVFISTHLDDAVLSAGQLISSLTEMGKEVSVVSVFTRGSGVSSPLNQDIMDKATVSDGETYFEFRRDEDVLALKTIGVNNIIHLGFIDAAWRSNKLGYSLYPKTTIGIDKSKEDVHLAQAITECLKKEIDRIKPFSIFAPLGWGEHVDHRIVNEASSRLVGNLVFYADFPYVQRYKNKPSWVKKEGYLEAKYSSNLAKKLKAISLYKTQNYSLFKKQTSYLDDEIFYLPKPVLVS